MILGNADSAAGAPETLDDLFRRAGVRNPQGTALIDPPNRAHFTDGPPRQLTYAQADRVISAIAAKLRAIGLPIDSVVALQLPNTVDGVLALLGILRAGMIAAPLPALWRRQEAAAALRSAGAKAIITCARIGDTAQIDLATQIAAEVFSIRHVYAFGPAQADGVVGLDEVFTAEPVSHPAIARLLEPSAHVAVVGFHLDGSGVVPMARNHRQLIAGGRLLLAASPFAEGAALLSTIPQTSFAGMATTLLPWLLLGGSLALHHAFDAMTFAGQTYARQYDAIVVPAPALPHLLAAAALDRAKTIVALWRAPERMAQDPPCPSRAPVIDVASFGEIGILAARRGAGGKPAALVAPSSTDEAGDAPPLVEIARSAAGTLQMRGAMIPVIGFPFGAEQPADNAAMSFLDTGNACRYAADGEALVVTAPPAGIASVGGYRFVARELDRIARSVEGDATLMTLPHELTGERLAGRAENVAAAAEELQQRGINPLITNAFRSHQSA